MNDNHPICPYCDTELNYDEVTDDSFDTSAYEVNWRGNCPICDRIFIWKEVYRYSHMEDLKEKTDNG